MTAIGKVDSLWRYPVKSMRGEQLDVAFLGFSGVYGDRIFAFTSSEAQKGFPFLTCREQHDMLQYQPRFRHPDVAAQPVNLAEAEKMAPDATPMYGEPSELMVDVETPSGDVLAIDDPQLTKLLVTGMRNQPSLKLVRTERAQTDCRPISVFSRQTVDQLGRELGNPIDPRRFRANVYLDLESDQGFEEEDYIGRVLRIGSKAQIIVLERDPRCVMITLDPDTGESAPRILKVLAENHEAKAGIYAAVVVEGLVRNGDAVEVI